MSPKSNITAEDREQFQYAQKRIRQKKRLNQHFVLFLIGSVFLLIFQYVLKAGQDFFIKDWALWVIAVWGFFFCLHAVNVFYTNRFMGSEWENRQLEKLRDKQRARIAKLEKKVEKEIPATKTPPDPSEDTVPQPEPEKKSPDQAPQDL